MKPASRKPVPRPVAVFAPPLIALVLASAYFKYQEREAWRQTEALCARFADGGAPTTEFALAAKEGGFTLSERGHGSASPEIVASRQLHGFREERLSCTVRHQDGTISSASTGRGSGA